MTLGQIVWIVVAAVFVLGLLPCLVLSFFLFSVLLVRTKPDKWKRACSAPDDPISLQMFNEGMEWAQKNAACAHEHSIVSDGKRLYGEYYDFGADRTAMILGGRTESMFYGYYFAQIYHGLGFNVFVADPRGHGKSDGRVNTVGFREWRDVLRWGELIHGEYGQDRIFIHGVCIGSETGLFALTHKSCPDYFVGMCAEGMFTSFCETFGTHMKQMHKPTFPLLYFVMFWLFLCSGGNAISDGPLRRIGRMKKPILFLHSKEDVFSLPEKSAQIYDKCTAPHEVVWFDRGAHSRIRVAQKDKYDTAIKDFLKIHSFLS